MNTKITTISAPSRSEGESIDRASRLLSSGDIGGAITILSAVIAANPDLSEAHHFLGVALYSWGQIEEAEAALREAIRLSPRNVDPLIMLSELLVLTDRALAARAILAPEVAKTVANMSVVTADAAALKSLRQFEDAVRAYQRARDLRPESAVAEHNLAGVYGDMKLYEQSEQAVQRAFAKGLDAPETWLVRARALQGLGRLDEAEAAYREVIQRRQTDADAHGELAQLIWMRTEDGATASADLDAVVKANPKDAALRLTQAQLREHVGDVRDAYAALKDAPRDVRASPFVEAMSAQLAIFFDPALAMSHARRAYAAAPKLQTSLTALCQAQLAVGDPEAALRSAKSLCAHWSLNQHSTALYATALRALSLEGYHELYDYGRFVKVQQLDTPKGWSRLENYVDDLAEALERAHRFRAHPIGQSIRRGVQVELTFHEGADPAIRAFAGAVAGPINRYIEGLGPGRDPLRARISNGYAFNGAWSVRLRPGGHHRDHIHPMGWISSACHVVTPSSMDRDREGWLKFGEPGTPTVPHLPAEHHIMPQAGSLVLFPSYMWHGTVPFSGRPDRLSLAFDLLPTGLREM